MTLPDPPLLIVTDRGQALLPLAEIVEAALEAGCRWIGVREKDLPTDKQIELAQNLSPMTRRFGAHLTLHGNIPFSASASAAAAIDGIHLPDGADASPARLWRQQGKLVGRSIHAVAQAKAAAELDYLVAGPVYESASKPGYGPSLGRNGLAAFARSTSLPVIAIGGVQPVHVGALMKAGAAGLAVMGSVMRASDPGRQVRALIAALNEARG